MKCHAYREARIAIIITLLAIMPGCALMEWFQGAKEAVVERHENAKAKATEVVDAVTNDKAVTIVNTIVDKALGATGIPILKPKTPDKDGDGGWGWILTYGAAFILGLKPEDGPKPKKKRKKITKKKGKK